MKPIPSKSQLLDCTPHKSQLTSRQKTDLLPAASNELQRKLLSDVKFYQSKIDNLVRENAQMYQQNKKLLRLNDGLQKLCQKLKKEVLEKRMVREPRRGEGGRFMGSSGFMFDDDDDDDGSCCDVKINRLMMDDDDDGLMEVVEGGGRKEAEKLNFLEVTNEHLERRLREMQEENGELRRELEGWRRGKMGGGEGKKEGVRTQATEQSEDEAEKEVYKLEIERKERYLRQLEENPNPNPNTNPNTNPGPVKQMKSRR